MDRVNKNRPGKPAKSHPQFHGSGEFFALGKANKSNVGLSAEPESRKPSSSSSKTPAASSASTATSAFPAAAKSSSSASTSSSSKSGERKREAGSSSSSHSSNPAKKIRVQPNLGPGPSFLSPTLPTPTTTATKTPAYTSQQPKPAKLGKREHSTEELGEIDPADLSVEKFLTSLEKAKKANDNDRAQALLTAGLKRFRQGKDKPDVTLCLGLLKGSKMFANIFRTSSLLDSLCSLVTMKRSGGATDVKTKLLGLTPSLFTPLAVSMIYNAFNDAQTEWPVNFVKMWVEDATAERLWVDNAQCKPFVDNLIFSFNTKMPPSNLFLPADQIPGAAGGSSPSLTLGDSDTVFQKDLTDILEENMEEMPTRMRYNGMEGQIETIILDVVKEIVTKKAPEVPRNVLRTLASACGLPGVRAFVITKMEQWIHNPKTGRQAQDLLLYLCVNSHCNTDADTEIVIQIARMRIKTKPLANLYSTAVKEMVRDNDKNLRHVLHQVIYNELTPGRNTNNLTLISAVVLACPPAHGVIAEIFMDLLQQRKEDFVGALRLMLREIVRATRHEFDLTLFIKALLTNKQESGWRDVESRERGFKAQVELITISMFLALSPAVKEAAVVRSDSKKDLSVISVFQKTLTKIQEEALIWMYRVVPLHYRPAKKDYILALNRIVFKDPANELQSKDNWPSESEKSIFARLTLETPVGEESLLWLLFQGFSKEHNHLASSGELLELVELMIIRSATHSGIIQLQKLELFEFLFRLCEYNHPENISLPAGYEPPKLSISKLYWKVWLILVISAAHSPSTYGKVAWDNYPMLKVLMEMCMTNHFSYPTVASTDSAEDLLGRERQTAAMEKDQILEFESHLAAASTKASITERNSLLLPQLMRLEPLGKARPPPQEVLTQLQALNDQLHLGHRLCKSRNPDFLVDLIQRNSQPMPWLSELVSEGSFEILPVQCLCEFMLGQTERIIKAMNIDSSKATVETTGTEKSHKKGGKTPPEIIKEDVKGLQLLHYLKDVLHGPQEDLSREVLEYFFRRLASKKMQGRVQALQGIQLLLSTPKKPLDENWLLDSIPTLAIFSDIKDSITAFLRQAIQVENEPKWVAQYLEFLSSWSEMDMDAEKVDIEGLAMDVAQLVVERNHLIFALIDLKPNSFDSLFVIFVNYFEKIREPHRDAHKWCDNTDQVLIQWPGEKLEASMNILIIHGIVILLSAYATILSNPTSRAKLTDKKKHMDVKYNELLDIWFPKDKGNVPKGFLLNTSEEAVLYPDWIKLRMLRSNNRRLLDAAVYDLQVDQLMLFVQSFGTPVTAMTAMLYILDTHVEKNPAKVLSGIVDPNYMNSLVELQWKRGASGGEKFTELLKSHPMSTDKRTPKDISRPVRNSTRPPLPGSSAPPLAAICQSEGVEKMDFTITKVSKKDHRLSSTSIKKSGINPFQTKVNEDQSSEESIRSLSKQLLTAASSASSSFRRRSSLPLLDDSTALLPRRHSSHYEAKTEQKIGFLGNTVGQLVDKIRDAEPCIVRNALDIQLPLLFGRNETPPPCRSFLLTVLTHESGWDTVEQCLNLFLKEFDPSYDPSTILDLISSTIKNPKLWQGCDKYVPKHQPLQSVFHLTPPQLLVMAEYIVEEISQLEVKNTKFSISNLLGPAVSSAPKNGKKTKLCLQQRVWQWLLCCNNNKEIVDSVIGALVEKKGRNPCTKKLISQVYLEFPEVILMNYWKDKPEELVGSEDDVSCILDSVSHALITAVANVQGGKDWYRKITNECEICLRKIASVHPILLLRQLSLMGALLEGRVHLDSSVFHAENHQVPFQVFLGLIDLMQPHVLKHFKILKNIFTLYIKLFTNFGHQRDYSSTLGRFSVLLHNLLSSNPIEMKEFLTLHFEALKELTTVKYYTDVSPFQNLMTSIVPPSAGSELTLLTSGEMDPYNMNSGSTFVIYEKMIHAGNHDEVVPVLQELDSLSTRNPAILQKFSELLIPLVLSENDNCRNLAFSLILKHVTYSPGANTMYLEVVLQGLQTSGSHLKDTLLERIPEFVVLAQENAVILLKQMFELGISSNVNILPAISKSLALLRSQTGSP